MAKKLTITVAVSPFICLDCGQVQFESDMESLRVVGKCDNGLCHSNNVIRAGPYEQGVTITVTPIAKKVFDKAER